MLISRQIAEAVDLDWQSFVLTACANQSHLCSKLLTQAIDEALLYGAWPALR
jgi:hypothetical protein